MSKQSRTHTITVAAEPYVFEGSHGRESTVTTYKLRCSCGWVKSTGKTKAVPRKIRDHKLDVLASALGVGFSVKWAAEPGATE